MYGIGELLSVGAIAALCFAYVGYKLFVKRGCSCGKKGGCGGAGGAGGKDAGRIAERPEMADACDKPGCCQQR